MMSISRNDLATASPLNQTWLRFTGKDEWRLVTGIVYACEWLQGWRYRYSSSVGFHRVTYSYRVDDETYLGKFIDFGLDDEDYFHCGDSIEIRYNPRHPQRSYYPDRRTQSKFRLICFAAGALIGIIVLLISFFSGRLH